MKCAQSLQAVFSGINFSDPNYPWWDVNGTYTVLPVQHPPQGYCQYNHQTQPDGNGVFLSVSVTTGTNYYHLTLALYKIVNESETAAQVFNAQGASIPLQNLEQPQNGGTATLE